MRVLCGIFSTAQRPALYSYILHVLHRHVLLYPIMSQYGGGLARPLGSYYCKFCGSNCALSMKLYVKSIQMTIPRNGGGGVESIKKVEHLRDVKTRFSGLLMQV